MKHQSLISIGIILPVMLFGMFDQYSLSARVAGCGDAFVAIGDAPSTLFYNPAGLSLISGTRIEANYEHLFSIVNRANFILARSIHQYTVAVGVHLLNIGDNVSLYEERIVAAGIGLPIAGDLYFGVSTSYYSLSMQRFGSSHVIGVDMGLIGYVYDRWCLGAVIHPLNNPSIGKLSRHYIPRSLTVGMSYVPFAGAVTMMELERTHVGVNRMRIGGEFQIHPHLTVRTGMETPPVVLTWGVSFKVKQLTLDCAFKYHAYLPITWTVGIRW